jgi:hypothetical protein
MTEDNTHESEPKPNWEEICVSLNTKLTESDANLKSYQFFSDQVLVNSTLYQGLKILLDKITKIEEKLLNGNKE